MQITKEHRYDKIEVPTSAYLNSESTPLTTSLSLNLNELLSDPPTSPHVNRLWKIKVYGNTIHFTTPDRVFGNTSLGKYFRQRIKYQSASGIVEPRDISAYKYRKLYRKFQLFLSNLSTPLPNSQRIVFISILNKVSENPNISISDLCINLSADNELALTKKVESGAHYIVVGNDINDVSYLYISNSPGGYYSLHIGGGTTLNNIIDSFYA